MPVMTAKPSKSMVHPCKNCGERPVWKNVAPTRHRTHYIATCLCGERDMGDGPKFLAVQDWNYEHP